MLLNKDRFNPTKTLTKLGFVIHDAESGDGAAQSLVAALKSPGDRISTSGHIYGSGYHCVTDGLGGYIEVADATAGPYAAPPFNADHWHACMPGFANQSRDQWQDELSWNHILGMAKCIVDKWNEDGQTWSLAFIFADQLKQGLRGYTSHAQISLAFPDKTDHTDPGVNFPFDLLAIEIGKLIQPPHTDPVPQEEDDEMNNIRFVRHTGYINVFMLGAGPALSITEELMASYPQDTPRVFYKEANHSALKAMCFQSGLNMNDPADLVTGGAFDHF